MLPRTVCSGLGAGESSAWRGLFSLRLPVGLRLVGSVQVQSSWTPKCRPEAKFLHLPAVQVGEAATVAPPQTNGLALWKEYG